MAPLHLAVQNDNYKIVKMLLQHGAGTELRNQEGQTVAEVAKVYSSPEVIALLEKTWSESASTVPAGRVN